MDFEEAEEKGKEYVKKRHEPTSLETLNCRYYKQSEEFVITFRVTDKNGVRRDIRVRYDKDGNQVGYELKQEKRDRY